MTTTFTKLSMAAVFITVVFGVFGYMSNTSLFINEASAQTSCGNCGTTGGSTGGGYTGGGDSHTPITPVCNLALNKTVAEIGESYRLTWSGTPSSATFFINGTKVDNSGQANFTFTGPNYDRFKMVGNNGGVECEAEVQINVKPIDPPVERRCDISASASVVENGGSVTLTWDTDGYDTITINGEAVSGDSGTRTYTNLTEDTVYTLRAVTADGNHNCAANVSVQCLPPPVVPEPICESFTATPSTITKNDSTTLAWETKNAKVLTINNGVGVVTGQTSIVVKPLVTTTYILSVYGVDNKKTICPVTVTVDEPEPDPLPVCKSFTVSPTTLPYGGGNVNLTWSTRNATEVRINNGVGVVAANDSITRTVSVTTTYTLTVENAAGKTVSCAAKVIVKPKDPTPISCEDNVSFTANPNNFRRGGDTTLTWSTSGITSVSFNQGINDTRLSGSLNLSPTSNTTYVLTASDGTNTVSCPVPVTVTTGGGGGGTVIPRCELTASDRSIKSGDRVTLRWDSTRAQDLVLVDSNDNTLVTTEDKLARDKDDLFEGSLVVRPTEDTTYTLTVQRGRQERTCEVDIEVDGSRVVVVENRDQQPLVSGISLTQVPYTGFEAGPFLTFVFYALLLGWALYLAYVIVMKQGGKDLVPTGAGIRGAVVGTEATTSTSASVATDEYTKPTFHPTTPTNLPTSDTVLGYANHTEEITPTIPNLDQTVVAAIENHAHAAHVLLSSDALRYFISTTEGVDRMSILDKVIAKVTEEYPTEDGWVVLNLERITNACAACMTPTQEVSSEVPVGSGSLAEAIVSGNVTAAYQMIGHRPMVALADAAADLDAAYRALQGESVTISHFLQIETATMSAEKLHAAIKALTGALDGTYATEEEAVKMAIMKAVKAVS